MDLPRPGHLEHRAAPNPRATRRLAPRGGPPVEVEGLYERLAGLGFDYGPAFQGLGAAWRYGEEIYAEVALAEEPGRGRALSASTRRCSTPPCTRSG